MNVSLTLSHRNTKRFNQFKNHYDRFVDSSGNPTYSAINVGLTPGTNTYKYLASINYGDYIYFFPYTGETRILKMDTRDDSFEFIGNFAGSAKFFSVHLADNGYIYAQGRYGTILKFDPTNDTFTTFGSFSVTTNSYSIYYDRKIWIIKNDDLTGLEFYIIDTNTDEISTFTPNPTGDIVGYRYAGITLGRNNCFYLARSISIVSNPVYDGDDWIIKYDPENNTMTTLDVVVQNTGSPANYGYQPFLQNGIQHPNGKLYFSCQTEYRWLIIDTLNNDSISYGNATLAGNTGLRFTGTVLGSNGNIFNLPFSDNSGADFEEFDVETNTASVVFDTSTLPYSSGRLYYCGSLSPNGVVYSAPFDARDILKIEFNTSTNFNKEFTQTQWFNSNR